MAWLTGGGLSDEFKCSTGLGASKFTDFVSRKELLFKNFPLKSSKITRSLWVWSIFTACLSETGGGVSHQNSEACRAVALLGWAAARVALTGAADLVALALGLVVFAVGLVALAGR